MMSTSLALTLMLAATGEETAEFGVCRTDTATVAIRWPANASQYIQEKKLRVGVLHKQRVSLATELLPLKALSLVECVIVSRRSPGTKIRIYVQFESPSAKKEIRNLYFHLEDLPRPNTSSLAPWKQRYVQRFCVPDGATRSSFNLNVEGQADAGGLEFELSELQLSVVHELKLADKPGDNLLGLGAFESGAREGVPNGWHLWLNAKPSLDLRQHESGKGRFLHIEKGRQFYLALADPIQIEQAKVYEMTFRARGTADITSFAHPLAHSRFYPLPLRTGVPQSKVHQVNHGDWKTYRRLWYSEVKHATMARPALSISSRDKGVEIDDVCFRKAGR